MFDVLCALVYTVTNIHLLSQY